MKRQRWTSLGGPALVVLGLLAVLAVGQEGGGERKAPKPKLGVAPAVPPAIVGALQEGKFDEAAEALAKLAAAPDVKAEDRGYFVLVRGIALRQANKLDAARQLLSAELGREPVGPWAAKIRGELANVELAGGRFEAAEALAAADAASLLAPERKDRLAQVYLDFAEKLLKPPAPVTPPDPEGAYALLAQAHELAQGAAVRAQILRRMGQASQAAGNPGRAIQDYERYLKDHPEGAERAAVRLDLGESQLAAGQPVPARATWLDLARDLAREPKEATEPIRAQALFNVARTHGIPAPGDDAQMNLGIAALRRFLEAFPSHPLAVTASYQVGASFAARGKSEQAIEALTAFLEGKNYKAEAEDARRTQAELRMTATFQIGQIRLAQGRFDEAIAAWRGYLNQFPNGPQSADAQRAIVDAQYLAAESLMGREEWAKAREALLAFAAQNPLDGRVPEALYRVGETLRREGKLDEAIAAWKTLAGKFPGTEPAAHGQFATADIFETDRGDPETAIERFKEVQVEPWLSQARQRIAVMESKTLVVVTPRVFRTGEAAHLKVSTRNIETLTFTAYALDPEAYYRKKHGLEGVESLDIGLVAPDSEWKAPVVGYARYKPVEATYELKVKVPGVFVVKVTDEKALQATTLVLGSDVDAIAKVSREQVLIFAQDMKTGKGRAGARVLVADETGVILEGRTGPDGVLLKDWEKPREPGAALDYLVLDGDHVAGTGLGVPQAVAQGLTPRAYLYTDRPAYRPGQAVQLRGVVREVQEGRYVNPAGRAYRLEVSDSRGRRFVNRPVTLSEFGTFAETLPLDSGAPVGSYTIRLFEPGKSEFAGQFEVQAYQLEKVDLAWDLPRTVYFRGEPIEADVVAKYQYGTPLAGRPVRVQLPDGRTLEGKTDAQGKFHVELPTDGFAEEQALRLVASLPEENVAAAASVSLAVRAFRVDVSTNRDVYLAGESFRVNLTAIDVLGEPSGQNLEVVLYQRIERAGQVAEREATRKPVATDPKTGRASVDLVVEDPKGGSYLVRALGTDRFSNPIVAERQLTISGAEDAVKLRLLADRTTFKVGDEARVNLHSRAGAGTALVAWEADRILSYKLVPLKEGDNALSWPVEGAQAPNFTLTAARMAGDRFDEARLDVRVERDLRVTVRPTKPEVGPGEKVEVEVTTLDQQGKPVAAELSLAMVDRALLRLYPDRTPPIGAFFHDRTRLGAFQTSATNTFRYEPPTVPVPEAVVQESERARAMQLDIFARGQALRQEAAVAADEVRNMAGMMTPAAPPMPASAPASAMGGMGGGGAMGLSKAQVAEDREAEGKDVRFSVPRSDFSDALGAVAGDTALAGRAYYAPRARGGASAAPVLTRQRFVETAYWNPRVVTGADGKARVSFEAPTALSDYRFLARGITAEDSLAGQETADLAVRQAFFVDIKAPVRLTQGDRPRFSAQVHHRGLKGTAEVRLTAYAGGREVVQPKRVEVAEDGVDEVRFDPFEVPEGDVVRLSVSARLGDAADEVLLEVPIQPWGVEAVASASGTSRDDTAVTVALPGGREYESPEMRVVISPSLRRMLVELALGPEAIPLVRGYRDRCIILPPPNTTADRAADLLAAASALEYLRATRLEGSPDAVRLVGRIQGLVAELVTLQNEDGGWPWVAGESGQARPSERMTSALATWALARAEGLGLLTEPAVLEKAAALLAQELAKVDASDLDTRAAIVHALATRGKASFELANALNRSRQDLSDAALAYLSLIFAELRRPALAGEVLDLLAARAKEEPTEPGHAPRRYWEGNSRNPWLRGRTQATVLAALALARSRPQAQELAGAVAWLEAHRQGYGWLPHKAKGPALAALGAFYGQAQAAEDRYRLLVTVNDKEVGRVEADGSGEGTILAVPREAIRPAGPNRVRFDIEGRGTFGYSVALSGFTREFGPDQDRANRAFVINRRVYSPAPPEFEGRPLPVGFGVAVNAPHFENLATQVALGGRVRVRIDAYRVQRTGQPAWEQDFLILRDQLPAGATLVEGSVQTQAAHYELVDGVLTFYFAPDQWPGGTTYDLYGYLPGQFRALPPRLSSAYEPGRQHLGAPGDLKVLLPGEPNTDPYKPTPDELYARGKALFEGGKVADAAEPLEALWSQYTLTDEVAKDAARMLLFAHIRAENPAKVVQYFEVLKERAPELVIPFADIQAVGRSYRAIGEHERATLVWRAVAEASYLEDARVGAVLRQRGRILDGLATLLDLWRQYPNTAPIEADFLGLAQLLGSLADRAIADPPVRTELAEVGLTRADLLMQAIRLTEAFLCLSPRNPMADEASLALLGHRMALEDYGTVVAQAARFASIYPKSRFLDSFQYAEALGRFQLGEYDRAIALAEKIAAATYKDAAGVDQPSPNKWQALYILGQIHDARRQPAKALAYYRRVADRFSDAASAVAALERKALKLPEVTVLRPAGAPAVAGVGLRNIPVDAQPQPSRGDRPPVTIDYRNLAEVDLKVYPVDLMRLYLMRRNLDSITGIDLAGIKPLHEATIKLGSGEDFEDKVKAIDLPVTKEGAYLVMLRGENLYASGVVLVSPLTLEVLEEPQAGRVRVRVLDAATRQPMPKVQVKVIGSDNPAFLSGETDLRGVYVAEGVRGQVTAVARKDTAQYAFHRGTVYVGSPPAPPQAAGEPAPAAEAGQEAQSLDANIKSLNTSNQLQQIERLERRYGGEGLPAPAGVQIQTTH